MENKDTRVRSVRISDATYEKIREITETVKGSQQDAFEKLITCYEMQMAKNVAGEDRGQIEQFEKYTNALNRMFMTALDAKNSAYAASRDALSGLIIDKDKEIAGLKKSLSEAADELEKMKVRYEKDAAGTRLFSEQAVHWKNAYDKLSERLSEEAARNKELSDKMELILEKTEKEKEGERSQYEERIRTLEGKLLDLGEELTSVRRELSEALEKASGEEEKLQRMELRFEREKLEAEKAVRAEAAAERERLEGKNAELSERLQELLLKGAVS